MAVIAGGLALAAVLIPLWRGRSRLSRSWVDLWMGPELVLVVLPAVALFVLVSGISEVAPGNGLVDRAETVVACLAFVVSVTVFLLPSVPRWWGPRWRHEHGRRTQADAAASAVAVLDRLDDVRDVPGGRTGVLVRRAPDAARLRSMKVLVDGTRATSVKWDSHVLLELRPGRHVVTARLDWVRSDDVVVEVDDGDVHELRVGWAGGGRIETTLRPASGRRQPRAW